MEPHLTHLFMELGDLQRAKWSWTEALGLKLLDDRGVYIAVGGNGGFAIGIEQVPADRVSRGGPDLTLRVADSRCEGAPPARGGREHNRRIGRPAVGGAPRRAAGSGRTPHVDLLVAANDHGRRRTAR